MGAVITRRSTGIVRLVRSRLERAQGRGTGLGRLYLPAVLKDNAEKAARPQLGGPDREAVARLATFEPEPRVGDQVATYGFPYSGVLSSSGNCTYILERNEG